MTTGPSVWLLKTHRHILDDKYFMNISLILMDEEKRIYQWDCDIHNNFVNLSVLCDLPDFCGNAALLYSLKEAKYEICGIS